MADSKDIVKGYENILSKSKTAYTANVKPTSSDIKTQQALMEAKKTNASKEGELLKNQWYPEERAAGADQPSYLMRALKTLQAPSSFVSGLAEGVLGKGTKSGLLENAVENVKESGTMGDILRSYGMSNLVAAPLGFALDIGTDPLTWATAGTGALLPKVAVGAYKGAAKGALIEGLGAGIKSGALNKAESFAKMIPGMEKWAYKLNSADWIPTQYRKVAEKAYEARGKYNEIIGMDVDKILLESSERLRLFDRLENTLDKTPFGKKLIKIFGYSPEKYAEEARIRDTDAVSQMNFKNSQAKRGIDPIADQIDDSAWIAENPGKARARNTAELDHQLQGEVINEKKFKDAIGKDINYFGKTLVERKESAKKALEAEGFETYNKLIDKALNSKVGLNILENYSRLISLFKSSKIGGNPGSFVNGLVGNIFMTNMIGVDIADARFLSSLKDGFKVARGKDANIVNYFTSNPEWRRVMMDRAPSFNETFGINPELFLRGKEFIREQAQKMAKAGKSIDGYADVLNDFEELVTKSAKKVGKSNRSVVDSTLQGSPTSMLSSEVVAGPYQDWIKKVEQWKNEGKPFATALHWYLTKPMDAYGKVDQTYRIGLALHLTENGISERELLTMAKRMKISPTDVIKVADRDIYKIKPERAMDIVQEVYLNYLAMPGFVQLMRTLPVLGSPFLSFTYGMTSNVIKTAMYNPQFFNKVGFLLKEINGRRSPLEKQALEQPYYSWYNKDGMVKLSMLPFFQENPVYLNIANMIPYYSLNIFNKSERKYQDGGVGGAVMNIIDQTPFFKTPEGQIFLDYMIQPLIIKEAQLQGSFGQPLWTKDAGFFEKAGRAGLAAAESIVPPAAGFAGLAIPSSVAPILPSYRGRQLSYAKEGKGSLGVPTKEPALEKTARVMSSMFGLPVYQLKLQFNQGKKQK